MKQLISITVYLIAIVAANLSVARFGASAVYINAFFLIGLDLALRDVLHNQWDKSGHLLRNMSLLILAGSIISYALNSAAAQIALGSFLAFGLSAIADTVVYARLRNQNDLVRKNGSNVIGALVDSAVFPVVAFGGFSLVIFLGQFAAKTAGGFVWSLVLRNRAKKDRS